MGGRAGAGPVVVRWAVSDGDRRRTGRALLARLIHELAPGADAALETRCAVCGGADHGPPSPASAPVAVSVSYADPLVVAAAVRTEDATAVGVDVENARTGLLDELAPLFAPADPPDIAGWTLIEAALKADGRGIRTAPGEVRLASAAGSTLLPGARLAHVPGRADPLEVARVAGPAGYAVSVCVARRSPR